MKNFIFLLFLCLVGVQSLEANTPPTPLYMPRIAFEAEVTCSLPAPSSLSVVNVGPDWAEVTWSSVPGAAQYRLQAFDGQSGMELGAPMFVSATVSSAVVSTAGNSGSAFVRIWSVCENGDYSTSNYTQSNTFDTIIIEIVASGFSFPSSYTTEDVSFDIANPTPISWTGNTEYFFVQYLDGMRRFTIEVLDDESPNVVRVNKGVPIAQQSLMMVFDLGYNGTSPTSLVIKYNINNDEKKAPVVAQLYPIVNPVTGQGGIYRSGTNNSSCIVKKVIPQPIFDLAPTGLTNDDQPLPLTERNSLFSDAGLSINPNPFSDHITIQLQDSPNPNGTVMHLYDLLGARRMSYQLPANQTACSLNTSQLEPGVYFLHLETDGHLQTIKLIKTL